MPSDTRTTDHIRVFLVDDHPAIREAIRDRIEETIDIEVCGEAESSDEAFRQIEKMTPDVAVVDISLKDAHGLDLVQNIQSQHSDVQIVVFSMYDEEVYAERAVRAGASGFLMKSEPTKSLIEAIRTVHDGEVYLSRRMASRILNRVARGESDGAQFPIDELTDRELAVFQMLGEGYSVEEIQDRLNLARKTIETYRRRAKEKLDFDSVSQLLQYAVQWNAAHGTSGTPTSGKPTSGKPTSGKNASGKNASGKDASGKEAAGSSPAGEESTE
jgi:DNA-binding NarL/FixJ family response regulator